jgi:iron complex outermembrane receptor protein
LAASLLRASYRDPFLACAGLPCASPSLPVAAGNRLAGTQPGSVWAELARRDARWGEAAVELRQVGRTAVNDSNSAFAPAYGLVALRWTKRFTLDGGWVAESLLRLDNAGGRRHVGSVIVNDANARFFEPGAPRHWLLALRLSTVR